MIELAHKAADGELSVRNVEAIARRETERLKEEAEGKQIKKRVSYYTEIEASLSEMLGTKVRILEGKHINALQISFKTKEDLENIVKYFQDEN